MRKSNRLESNGTSANAIKLKAHYACARPALLVEDITKEAAAAARLATQIQSFRANLIGVLDSDQQETLEAAQMIAQGLAADIKFHLPWARERQRQFEAQLKADDVQRARDKEMQLWPTDEAAFEEAENLIAYFAEPDPTGYGLSHEAVNFIRKRHMIYAPVQWQLSGYLAADMSAMTTALKARDATRVRQNAMAVVRCMPQQGSFIGQIFRAGLEDYRAWCEWRTHACKATANLMAAMKRP